MPCATCSTHACGALGAVTDRQTAAAHRTLNAMSFATRMAAGSFPVALEITPPQRSLPHVLLRRARILGDCATAVNVIQRPSRQSSLDASIELRTAGFAPCWHLVTRGKSREELLADLQRAATGGIRQVLCIRGDHAADDPAGAPTIREAVGLVAEALPGALIGATANQYLADHAAVLRNLLPKLAAGASYVQTQPVFAAGGLDQLAEAVKERSPSTKVVAMVMPLPTAEEAERIAGRLGLSAVPSGIGWDAFDELVASLAASPLVDAMAIMTLDMDPPPEAAAEIVESLKKAGLA
jgi:methylenetetrahydrofolate reductase (NADPH)